MSESCPLPPRSCATICPQLAQADSASPSPCVGQPTKTCFSRDQAGGVRSRQLLQPDILGEVIVHADIRLIDLDQACVIITGRENLTDESHLRGPCGLCLSAAITARHG